MIIRAAWFTSLPVWGKVRCWTWSSRFDRHTRARPAVLQCLDSCLLVCVVSCYSGFEFCIKNWLWFSFRSFSCSSFSSHPLNDSVNSSWRRLVFPRCSSCSLSVLFTPLMTSWGISPHSFWLCVCLCVLVFSTEAAVDCEKNVRDQE